jgi:very-short-patch-repair endonuclease
MADVVDLKHHSGALDRPRQVELAKIAGRQHGVIARRQLLELGFGRGAIRYKLAVGRLHSIHREVYAVGHANLTARGRWMAAVLACGQDALLSHKSAAALWGFGSAAATDIDVTTTGRTRYGLPGIALHLVRGLHPDDRALQDAIPVTSVSRTILDLAEVLPQRRLERAFEEAERLQLLDMNALRRLRERAHGRHGLIPLDALLSEQWRPYPEMRSELERLFYELCRNAGLPPPAMNVIVAGFEVDAVWPDHKLIVELDGYAFHRTRAAFERDRLRDAALQTAGYRVLRATYRRLSYEPDAVIGAIRALLSSS